MMTAGSGTANCGGGSPLGAGGSSGGLGTINLSTTLTIVRTLSFSSNTLSQKMAIARSGITFGLSLFPFRFLLLGLAIEASPSWR